MANYLLNRAWAVPPAVLRGATKAVLTNFCDRADASGAGIYPSNSTVALEIGSHRATVSAAIAELQRKGFIRFVRYRSKGIVEWSINTAALKWERRTVVASQPVAKDDTYRLGRHPSVAKDDTHLSPEATQTSREPSVEALSAVADAPGSEIIKKVLDELADAHAAAARGAVLMINRKRDVPLVRNLLRHFTPERIVDLFVELLTLPTGVDEWVDKGDRGLPVLMHRASFLDRRVTERAIRTAEAVRAAERRKQEIADDENRPRTPPPDLRAMVRDARRAS